MATCQDREVSAHMTDDDGLSRVGRLSDINAGRVTTVPSTASDM